MWLPIEHRDCAITPTSPLVGEVVGVAQRRQRVGDDSRWFSFPCSAWERSSAALRPFEQEPEGRGASEEHSHAERGIEGKEVLLIGAIGSVKASRCSGWIKIS